MKSSDDAAVLQIEGDNCLISTADFFTPIVDNANDFGKIAASNALSDVYAMGGKPLMAIAILGWPVDTIPASVAAEVLSGARFMCRIAGIPLAGGHSIESKEPFFGLAVSGIVKKEHLKKNNTAREGDFIFLTKPLGTGIISAAAKRNLAKADDLELATAIMTKLNNAGEAFGKLEGIHAMTDITGFGLVGHLIEMTDGSGLSAEINVDAIPAIPGISEYTDKFIYPDMTMKTYSAFADKTNGLPANKIFLTCDPQTSGGLLTAVSPEAVKEYLAIVSDFGLQGIADKPIGRFISKNEKSVYFK